jgi:predicted patatin/cPLA2 family phospholipase
MLDGGIADSIPVKRAINLGYDNVVVVLTRNKGYRKPNRKSKIPPFVYSKYPALREAIAMRNIRYNEQLDYIESLEEQGQIIVIRPIEPIVVDRLERDIAKLTDLYNQGYKCAQEIIFE